MDQSSLPLPELSFGKDRRRIRPSRVIAALARRLWPSKTAVNLASRTDVSVRAAELWLEDRNDMSAEALVQLLRSDVGYEVLQDLMQGAPSSWWRDFERGVRIRDIDKKIEWQRAALAKLKADFTG